MTLDERKQLRTALIELKFRRQGVTKNPGDGKYQERWVRTRRGRTTDTVLIDWDKVTK